MNGVRRYREKGTSGSTATGESMADVMYGCRDVGTVRHIPERIGAIHTTIITRKAGECMKAIGTGRITATTMTTITILGTSRLPRLLVR
jgi:hypothetical protein